jgi:hypothetical protein
MQLDCSTTVGKYAWFQTVDSVAWKLGEGDYLFFSIAWKCESV